MFLNRKTAQLAAQFFKACRLNEKNKMGNVGVGLCNLPFSLRINPSKRSRCITHPFLVLFRARLPLKSESEVDCTLRLNTPTSDTNILFIATYLYIHT